MSLKGFQKGIVRAPQSFKAKFNIGEHTKDVVYSDAERRFQELEKETKKLHDESQKYFNAINGMLNHQIEFSKAMTELYKPISGRASDPSTYTIEGNPEGIRACEEYEVTVGELQEALAPELDMIDSRIISPADQLLEVIKVIRKVAVKRDHKKIDYDRRKATWKKLDEKKDKSLKDEKALYKAESDMEQATQDYNTYNDLLKEELPRLFALEAEFIRPLFQSFYYMQLNVFYTLHEKMQAMNISYFDLTLDVEEAFNKKRGDVKERAEELSIVHYKTTAGRKPGAKPPVPGSKPNLNKEKFEYDNKSTFSRPNNNTDSVDNPPPPYSAAAVGSSASSASSMAAAAKGKPAPPPPKPKPSQFRATETATALYDYEAQAHDDLSFSAGDVIEITQRTENTNEWWSGKIDGRQGQFPALDSKLMAQVDSAVMYRNEKACGQAIKNSNIDRSELFYTTKIPPGSMGYDRTKRQIDTSLKEVGLEYIDLFLIHSPYGGKEARLGSWRALVEAQQAGKIRSIGISNYGVHHLDELEEHIRSTGDGSKIDVGQYELHPWCDRREIVSWLQKRNIVVEAYSPMAHGTRMNEPLLKSLGKKYGKTPAQIMIRWAVQNGFVPLPKSATPQRIKENADIFDFELSDDEVNVLHTGEYSPTDWDPTTDRD